LLAGLEKEPDGDWLAVWLVRLCRALERMPDVLSVVLRALSFVMLFQAAGSAITRPFTEAMPVG